MEIRMCWSFRVGVAVLTENGKIYEGCNVERWVSGFGFVEHVYNTFMILLKLLK
jgi:hypothetical protein